MKIDGKTIDSRLLEAKFRCDLNSCHGACCTAPGGSGPPIRAEEMEQLERAYSLVRHVLPEEHVRVVEKYGLFEREGRGWAIRCFNRRACVFVVYDGKIAKCSIHDAYREGKFDWPKPQSCHLFPLRVRGTKDEVLEFETFTECRTAQIAGEKENVSLIEFIAEPLTRAFGEDFQSKLMLARDGLEQTEDGCADHLDDRSDQIEAEGDRLC